MCLLFIHIFDSLNALKSKLYSSLIARGFVVMVSFARPVKTSFLFTLFITVFFSPFQLMATDDAYLKMLEGEAENSTLDQSGQLHDQEVVDIKSSKDSLNKTNWTWEGNLEGDILPLGLAQDEFTLLLEQNFYGTFVFYRKLSSIDKQTVHYHYTKNQKAELDAVRKEILDLLKR